MSIPLKSLLLALLPLLAGCEQSMELLGLPNPGKEAARAEAEGKAVGGACRLAGRSLEDCYALNPSVAKASVLVGWKEMNDYMAQNNVEVIPSRLPSPGMAAAANSGDEAADSPAADHDKAAEDTTPTEEEQPRRRPRR